MNGHLLKEVEAGKEVIVQLRAAAKAAVDQRRQDSEAAERKEERMGQMCNALKAAEQGEGRRAGSLGRQRNRMGKGEGQPAGSL